MNEIPPLPPSAPSASETPSSESLAKAPRAVRAIGRWPGGPLQLILLLLILYTLYFARDVLVPIAIAMMFNLLLSPVVLLLKQLRVPEPLGAALVVVAMVGGLGWGIYALSSPAAEWLHKAPESLGRIEQKIRMVQQPVQEVTRATKEMENLAQVGGAAAPTVAVREQSRAQTLVTGTTLVATQIGIVVVLLYFLLAAGDTFMRRLVRALSRSQDKRRAVGIVRAVQRDISLYLGTVTLINAGLGTATAVGMAILGLPNPVLWGAVAMTLNFIPYLGAFTTTVILAGVGLLTFNELGHALVPPAIFQVLANIESNLVTPYLLGRSLTIQPALVVLALVLWGWLWGIPGALLAVPFLVLLKIFADHIDALEGISIFLGRRDPT